MKRIKLFRTYDVYSDDYSSTLLAEGVSDWEEVSDEDFAFIKKNKFWLDREVADGTIVIIEQVPDGVNWAKTTIKEAIEAYQRENEKREAAERERKAKAKAARAAKKAQTDEARLRKLLEDNPRLVDLVKEKKVG